MRTATWFIAAGVTGWTRLMACIGPAECHFSSREIVVPDGIVISVATGDLNGDTRPDIAVRTWDALFVLLNASAGTFASSIRTPLPYFGGAADPLMADFNGDGRLDLALRDRNEILLGAGDGTFLPPQAIRGDHPTFFGLTATGDFNGDQIVDLVFFVRGSFGMLLGNGGGTFRFGTQGEIGDGLLYVADFNSDGRSDLALLHGQCRMIQKVAYGIPTSLCRSTSLRVFLARADGSFEDPIETSGIEVAGVLVADINRDGFPDIAAVVENGSGPGAPVVLPGNGDGTFRVPGRLATEYDTVPVGAADLDGDANLDLVLMGRDAEGGNGIYVQFSGRAWYLALWETVDRRVGGIADFDDDGSPDLVTAVYAIDCASRRGSPCSDQSNRITVLLNRNEAASR